ncbi:transcription factor HBP-1b(c38)-like [Dorcoceras hygrometricum]|uniref:Transcription factor HBP-1b(C38)-like n=1 Tax=Dorcoceras hygrometricum TaxID=472368 RepID=A0A2Z7ALR8_9LAMI|nr:transcription factor HBP-1b(c38)-like [Dorcoceras hygrometricum]
MTSSKLIEDFSSHDIESWAVVRCIRSDTVADQELKIVNRIFGGLNEGIWPKSSLGHERSS